MVRRCVMAMIAGLLLGPVWAVAQEPAAEPTRVSPGASTRVWIMAAWDDACKPLPAPRIDIVTKPAKGAVTFREGQATTVKSSKSGTCIGARVTGTGVYYTANSGAEGPDAFAIEARLPTGEAANRAFRMMIAD
jgi:hypothetical protein